MSAPEQDIKQVVRTPRMPPPAPGVQALAEDIRRRHGPAVLAVLFYGSCLRSGDDRDQIADFYVLVDSYARAHISRLHALLNRALPPGVYYLETRTPSHTARAKYAVLSLRDFERGTSRRWFHSYLWGRFAQPATLVYTRDSQVRDRVHNALAGAAITLAQRSLPCLPEEFDALGLWEQALRLSYSAELRSERPERARELVDSDPDYYERLARAAMPGMPFPVTQEQQRQATRFRTDIAPVTRRLTHVAWHARRLQGKLLSILRLIKGLITFNGGVDYIVWKIERHSGIAIELTPRLRRYPLLGGWVVLWRLYRSGGIR